VEKRVSADQVQLLDNSVTRLVSVFYLEHHFVTAVIDYMSLTCTIYDGLRYNQVKWMEHLENILKRYNLIPIDSEGKSSKSKKGSSEIVFSYMEYTSTWTLRLDPTFVKQNDSHNCGPLSCLKVYELFIDKDIFMDTDVNSYRLDVMDK
jgi:hypothetical protein